MFKGKVMFGKISKRWERLLFEYGRRYGRHQAICHLEEHGYISRKNGRWGIPENERHYGGEIIIKP